MNDGAQGLCLVVGTLVSSGGVARQWPGFCGNRAPHQASSAQVLASRLEDAPLSTRDEVEKLELLVDGAWFATALPYSDWRQSVVTLMTVVEDTLRRQGPGAADNLKFALRSLLELALRNGMSHVVRPPVPAISERAYRTSVHAMEAADSYEAARLAFGCFWAGKARYEFVSGRHVMSSVLCPRHEMLDRLVPLHDVAIDLSDNPVPWARETIIGDSSFDRLNNAISYAFRESVPRRLARALPKPRARMPDEWMAWGVRAGVVRQVLQALVFRCSYHAIAVDEIANYHRLESRGLDQLLLRLEWDRLIAQICRISSVSGSDVALVLGKLLYGTATTNPDPALQPIVAVGPMDVVVPCWIVTSSSVERNFLTLQARIDKSSFNSQSWLFERDMRRDLEVFMRRLGIRFRSCISTQAGEADLVLASPDGRTVFVVELKWFMPPGDFRETLERVPTVERGADQAQRKLSALRHGGAQAALELASPPVNFIALVVTEGFSTQTGDPCVGCVPSAVFKLLLKKMTGGVDLTQILSAQPWLPVEGKHFQRESKDHKLGGVTFEWSCHYLLPESDRLAAEWICDDSES